MRTNIEIDDQLLGQVMLESGTRTEQAAVDAALRLFVQIKAQEKISELWGTVQWEGDLEQSRLGHVEE